MKIQSDVLLQAVFHSNPVAIAILTLGEGVIVDVNESFSQITGYTREDVLGKTTREAGFWKEPEKRGTFADELAVKRVVRDARFSFPNKEGEMRSYSGASEIFESGGKEYVVTMLNDITDIERITAMEHWRRESAEALQRMTLDIMSSLELDQVLQNVLTYLGQVIAYDSVCLFLLKDRKSVV